MATAQIKRVNTFLHDLTEKKVVKRGDFIAIQRDQKSVTPYDLTFKRKMKFDQSPYSNPKGIWASIGFDLSDDDQSWLDYCYMEGQYDWIDPKKNRYYTFSLKKNAKIYKIQPNNVALQRFFKKYGVTIKNPGMDIKIIDWKRVKEDGYDGVQYVKYAKFKKNLPTWYDVIDASLICVWNVSAIRTLKKL